MDPVTFVVYGVAQPKGSTRAFMRKGARFPIVTSDNPQVKTWEAAVRSVVRDVANGVRFEGAVSVRVTFDLPRPKSLPQRVRHHIRKPDLDKLARSSLDALTGTLLKDDAQVIDLHVTKRYGAVYPSAAFVVEEVGDGLF